MRNFWSHIKTNIGSRPEILTLLTTISHQDLHIKDEEYYEVKLEQAYSKPVKILSHSSFKCTIEEDKRICGSIKFKGDKKRSFMLLNNPLN